MLTRPLLGDRLWLLLEDPFTVLDDVSPRVLLKAGLIALAQRGGVKADQAEAYRLTTAGHAALRSRGG